ncbi:MAG TPA: M20/M25/M40 family metallo-hydrolase [Bacillales bacterium]|nr:M20/M25/M40 family metallo-hydrolase [Bacillales bacterium]
MYETLKKLSPPQQVEHLTRALVQMPSVNGTKGETEKAKQIKQWISEFPYFQRHPDDVWEQPVSGDEQKRNIFALVKGRDETKATIICHGHLDTVGVNDFGRLERHAFDPDELQWSFQNDDENEEVREDARSGDWMFGRGALDMQSGVAVHLVNLLDFSENAHELDGNILMMFNPDEESEHKGVISAISELQRLREAENLDYVCAINSDFISPLFAGDDAKYLYTGAAGKLLPSFYIYGRESHVGETLKGIDSTYVASEINRRLSNNIDLTEPIEGEVVNPPSCLHQRDHKEAYNVQTAFKTFMYFNYFLYEENPKSVLEKLKRETRIACDAVEKRLKVQYLKSLETSKLPASDLSWHLRVDTLEEFIQELENQNIDTQAIIEKVSEANADLDLRERAFRIVDALQQQDPQKNPRVVVFFSPPHCPHNYLQRSKDRDNLVLQAMRTVAEDDDFGETFAIKRFFPFLSDSSYLNLHETDEELDSMINNFVPWGKNGYSIPVKQIRSLSIPAVNMGVYGKDAHKWTERVYKPYSFEVLPKLIRKFMRHVLREQSAVSEERKSLMHV